MRRISLAILVSLVAVAMMAPAAAQAHLAVAKLGPPPVECQSAFGVECAYGLGPLYMGNTYIGGLHISPHLIHEGETVTETFYPKIVRCISGEPCASSWYWSLPGEPVSSCGREDLSCTFKAIYSSAYPPTETSSGWSGGWDVAELGICGFNGCANASDYYYVVPGNLRGLSGSVRNASGEPLLGAEVEIEGAAGSETVEVDPTTGTYSVILPPGRYSVTVDSEGGEAHPVQCTNGRIHGGGECEIDLTENDGNASFVQNQSLSIVGTPKVAEPSSGSTPEQFKIAISEASEEPVTVKWATADSSATAAAGNYKAAGGEVTIPAGARSVPVTVQVLPGNGTTQTPAVYYFAKIVSVVSGSVTVNQKARQALGTILVPGVAGVITGPPKSGGGEREPVSGVTMSLSGTADSGQSVSRTTTSDTSGEYRFRVDPGKYTVTPTLVSPKGEKTSFNTEACEGKKEEHSCELTLPSGTSVYTANFSGGLLLLGKVVDSEGKGVAGVKVSIAGPESKTVETESEAGFKAELGPGTYTVTAQPREKHEYFAVESEDCKPTEEGKSCTVALTKDRSVEFTECVLANPNGEPLPAKTPDPIPGAITHGQLEAVGCFTHHSDGTDTSERNVRLDGVDVVPTKGASIVIDGTSVTSTGPVLVKVDGFTLMEPSHFHFTYGGSSVATNDISSNSPTLAAVPNIFGIPVALGSGGALSSPMLQATKGTTTFTLAGQAVLPLNTTAKWNIEESGFTEGKNPVRSLGVSGSFVTTNRGGFQPGQFCVKVANASPFGKAGGEISQAVLCWAPTKHEWSLQALYNLPSVAAKFVRQVNLMGSIVYNENGPEGLLGYRLRSAELQLRGFGGGVEGINGIPLGDGVFFNGAGGGWTNDLSTEPAKLKNFNLTGALTLGPEVQGESMFSLDGQVKVQPFGEIEGKQVPSLYEVEGLLTALHGTPLQIALGHSHLRFTFSPYVAAEIESELGLALGPLGGFEFKEGGFWDGKNEVFQLEGGGTSGVGPLKLTAEGVLSAGQGKLYAVACLTGGNRASKGSGFAAGALQTFYPKVSLELFPAGTCDIGKYKQPAPVPAAASASAPEAVSVKLSHHLRGTVLAVKGVTSAPLVTLTGPGVNLTQPSSETLTVGASAKLVRDEAAKTTYVVLYSPAAGTYSIAPRAGSSGIASVMEADAAPIAKVSAHVSVASCRSTVRYHATVPKGVRVALYAKGGRSLAFLGYAHNGRGRASFSASPLMGGHGQILALESASGYARPSKRVASYMAHATRARVRGLRVRHGTVTWEPSCGPVSYTATVTVGKRTRSLQVKGSSAKLPSGHGSATVTVVAHGAAGASAPARLRVKL